MTNVVERGPILSDERIARCGERAAAYDRENRFFSGPDLQNEDAAAGSEIRRSARLPRQDMEALS